MEKIELNKLIDRALDVLTELGLKESTVNSYKGSGFNIVRKFFIQSEEIYYDSDLMDKFILFADVLFKDKRISERHYRRLKRSSLLLMEIYHSGTIQWRYSGNRYKYKTNEYFNGWLDQFIKIHHLSKGTLAGIKSVLLDFLSFLEERGHNDFNALSQTDLKAFILSASKRHTGSMNNVLYSLRLFMSYIMEKHLVTTDFKPILYKAAHRIKKVLPCFTHDEVKEILNEINTSTGEGKRDYAVLYLASHTGLRSIDITNLRLTDIDWKYDEIHIVQRKTCHPLTLPLEPDTGGAIAEYILHGRPDSDSEYIFLRSVAPFTKLADVRSLGNILEKYRKKAGLIHNSGDGKCFHALRRSMGTWMMEAGIPLSTISQILGHKKQDSTKQYLSMDHKSLVECALGFQGIPIEKGVFE